MTVEVGEGSDYRAYLTDDGLIVRVSKEPVSAMRANRIRREAALLAIVKSCSPPQVPEVAAINEAAGSIAYPKLDGVPLIECTEFPIDRLASAIGPFLSRLHSLQVDRVVNVVPREAAPMLDWLEDARMKFAAIDYKLPENYRSPIAEFLESPLPAAHVHGALCHNDLGAEHILVNVADWAVTAIFDWSDAAITDPARDFALIYRDLGTNALDVMLAQYVTTEDVVQLRERALFFARCSALDDIEYGRRTGRAMYADRATSALSWLFSA